MIDAGIIDGFLGAAVRIATPLLLAALGEMLSERGGVINLGVEGAMLTGALAAAIGASAGGTWTGLAASVVAGLLLASIFALAAIGARADQIIAGTATTLLAVGVTGAVYQAAFGSAGAGLTLPTLGASPIPGLAKVPLAGPALFNQPVTTYIALLAVPLCWWFLFRTRTGLALRAVGESPEHARAAGVPVRRLQFAATLTGGAFAGLAGGTLVLAQVGTFAERMTAGRGFIAIAIVVLGRWHPVGVLAASLLFGAATALQFVFQAMGLAVPYQLFLMLPYVLTLLLLAGLVGGVKAPAALGRPAD
ncbi:MAG TPA: ABC transporter permease [Candidatus Limnocylindria bacterium]|jgi:simple sugar transport system permease protein|nr:ABC transporter permease [Candidatus Limnocylindria bacterium]